MCEMPGLGVLTRLRDLQGGQALKLTRLTALVGAIALVTTACGSGVNETAGSDGSNEGIQVHGHWTLDIYNEDGSLDESHEFENALTEQGKRILGVVLAKTQVLGSWEIRADGFSDTPCRDDHFDPDIPTYCAMNETPGLQVHVKATPLEVSPLPEGFKLVGSFVADTSGTIGQVKTGTRDCERPITIERCSNAYGFLDFTAAGSESEPLLDEDGNPYDVAEGQQVQVTVEISFS